MRDPQCAVRGAAGASVGESRAANPPSSGLAQTNTTRIVEARGREGGTGVGPVWEKGRSEQHVR